MTTSSHRSLPVLCLWIAGFLLPLRADDNTVLISETFGGSAAANLSGQAPPINLLSPGAVWAADPIIAANGQINDGTNTDRGAVLDLGAGFAFQPNHTYTLVLNWTNLDNAILFAGFSSTLPNTGAQMQTQGTNFALRARRITAGTDTLAAWKNPGSVATTGSTVTPAAGTATLVLSTAGLSNASFTVTGVATPVSVDLTAGFRYLWIAYEDPTTASPASDGKFVSLTLSGPAPAPQPDPPMVEISPSIALINAGQQVTLTATPSDAQIRFTLDGSTPTATSALYSAPVTLNSSATVQAIGIKDGIAGPVAIRSYVLRQPIGTPNLLLIIGETIGFGDLQCYGGVNIATPALDSLAQDGIRFTQFTTTGPSALASQFAMLTGRVAARSGMGTVVSADASGWKSEEWSLAESLRRGGYETAFIGEWLLGNAPGSHPNDQGFRLFHGLPFSSTLAPPLMENRAVLNTSPDPSGLLDNLTTRAVHYLGQTTEPFALVFQAPALPGPDGSLAGPHGDRIEALDQSIGQMLAALQSRGIADQTLVVFASDGGAPRTAEGGSNGVLRDGQGTTWEGGIRVPLIARLPGTLPPGQMNLSLLWQPDLMPTFASLLDCDLAGDRTLDGTPRPDVLKGTRTRPAGDEKAVSFRYANNAWQLATVRQGKWKSHQSIVNIDPLNTNPTSAGQLFDLHVDAEESINRAGQESATLTQLQNLAGAVTASLPAAGTMDLPAPKAAVRGNVSTHLESTPAVRYSFSRPLDSIDDFYLIERSTDLLSWQTTPITNFISANSHATDDHEDVEVLVPLGVPPFSGPRMFIRLSTSRPANP